MCLGKRFKKILLTRLLSFRFFLLFVLMEDIRTINISSNIYFLVYGSLDCNLFTCKRSRQSRKHIIYVFK